MDDQRGQQPAAADSDNGYSTGPEVDDSGNPTAAAPDAAKGEGDFGGERVSTAARSGEETWTPGAGDAGTRGAGGREMLVQLQQMIDTIATQATPVVRQVAAKAAELAAIAGEKAGPVAYKAAGVTEKVGQRVAARSKDFAADLRRQQEASGATQTTDEGSEQKEVS